MPESECRRCVEKDDRIRKLLRLVESKEKEIAAFKAGFAQQPQSARFRSSKRDGIAEEKQGVLNNSEILRYGRQLVMPEIGMSGQCRLKNASVLVVGAGGLGCPATLYLAAAGVGRIGVVDGDAVEASNLHRQIAHTEEGVGSAKSESLAKAVGCLNSSVVCESFPFRLTSDSVARVLPNYDIVIDASDNLPTRYLLSDACVLFKKPLVSGSALRFEGQLTVYNDGSPECPCYRCLYPVPPPPDATTDCSDGGVLGPVTGFIGSLQALEVLRLAVGMAPSFRNKLLHFDGECGSFRTFKLRGKNPDCKICGTSPSITKLVDYEQFCQSQATDEAPTIFLLPDVDRITCENYKKILDDGTSHLLIDVRTAHELDICSLPHALNVPLNELHLGDRLQSVRNSIRDRCEETVYVICRRGNDSQKAVGLLRECLKDLNVQCFDIIGGFQAWHCKIDPNLPIY